MSYLVIVFLIVFPLSSCTLKSRLALISWHGGLEIVAYLGFSVFRQIW